MHRPGNPLLVNAFLLIRDQGLYHPKPHLNSRLSACSSEVMVYSVSPRAKIPRPPFSSTMVKSDLGSLVAMSSIRS
jgi:hypothetical protein